MKIGTTIRVMGPQSTSRTLGRCARAAEAAGMEELWVADHLAIPPDDSEGSGGRYLDPLTTLSWLAAQTERIGLATGILNLPYRRPLPTAKAIATLQELSGDRLRLGVGVGWMEPEFRALGIDRTKRGRTTDEVLDFLAECFEHDVVTAHGQEFLFLPRPRRPEILVGGMGRPARRRAVRSGDAWLPLVGRDPEKLAPGIEHLRELAQEAGRRTPEVVAMGRLPIEDSGRMSDFLGRLDELGVSRVAHAMRYQDEADFQRGLERLQPWVE